jgi:proteasome lid subunit RPN8/RPN11
MSAVLDYFRNQVDEKFKQVPDELLTKYIGEEHPEFLKDPEFEKDFSTANMNTGSMHGDLYPGGEAGHELPVPPEVNRLTAQVEQARLEYPAKEAERRAQQSAENWDTVTLGPAQRAIGLDKVGKGFEVAGRATLAGAGDLANLYKGDGSLENLGSMLASTEEKTPVEQGLEELKGWQYVPTKIAAGAFKAAPQLVASAGLGVAGAGRVVAALPFAFTDKGVDPVNGLIALTLPGVSKFGEELTAAGLSKLPIATAKGMVAGSANGAVLLRLKELTQKVGGVEISNDALRTWVERGGGIATATAYLTALQTPEILALPQGEREQAAMDAVAYALGPSLIGLTSRAGESKTFRKVQEQFAAKAQKAWNDRMRSAPETPNSKLQISNGEPAEEGAPVPPQEESTPVVAPENGATNPNVEPATTELSTPITTAAGSEPVTAAPVTTPDGEGAAPVEPTIPPAGAAKPPELVMGRESYVTGANKVSIPVRYAWVPLGELEASHGENFGSNPAYAPLKNTREYDSNPAEQEKVLDGANNFDPETYAVNAKGASEGPVMVSRGSDGVLRVMGGNGRAQMLQRLNPEQWGKLQAVQAQEAVVFGLPKAPTADSVIVRVLPDTDVSTPEGISKANLVVDLLNPSAGLVETQAKMAENDAMKVPLHALRGLTPNESPGVMRDWMRRMISDGVIDRNTRMQVLSDDGQLTDYVQRLLVQSAYRDNHVSNVRNEPRQLATVRGMIDAATPALINLREKGPEGEAIANSFTQMVSRVADYQKEYPSRKLNSILEMVGDQSEMGETREVGMARALAKALASQVELLPINRRGERKIDEDETVKNFAGTLSAMANSVRQFEAGGDLFGTAGDRTIFDAVEDFLKARGTVGALHETGARYGVDPRVARYRKLEKLKAEAGKLTVEQEREREGLERELGQDFMGFYNEQKGVEQAGANQAELIKAGMEKRLKAGPLVTQGALGFEPGQLAFFERTDALSRNAVGAMEAAQRALEHGRQVVLYPADAGVGTSALEAMVNMLEKRGGVGSVGRVLGMAQSVAAQRHAQRVLSSFAEGSLRVIVAGAEPGRELVGKRQVARIAVDSGAGGSRVGEGEEPGQIEERRSRYKDPRQVEFNFEEALARLNPNSLAVRLPGGVDRTPRSIPSLSEPGLEVYAESIRRDLVDQGYSIIGRHAGTPAQLALSVYPLRNPAFETLRYVIVKDGLVVETLAISAMHPNTTYADTAEKSVVPKFWNSESKQSGLLADLMRKHKADGFYLVHNHPSGNPEPSGADLRITEQFGKRVQGFLGHVIINGKRYAFIDMYGHEELRPFDVASDPLAKSRIGQRHGDLLEQLSNPESETIYGPEQVAKVGKAALNKGMASVVFLSTRLNVRALADMEMDVLRNGAPEDIAARLQRVGGAIGAARAVIYLEGDLAQLPEPQMSRLMAMGIVTDFVVGTGYGDAAKAVSLRGKHDLGAVRGDRWFGRKADERDAMILKEDAPDKGDTFKAAGLYFTTPVVKGSVPANMAVTLGGMSHVRPVEMPELVKLARELCGSIPTVKKMRGALGVFRSGGPGRIALDPRIFKNSDDAAKVLAHETGHLIDYLPDHYMKRGNMLGRIHTLRDFLKNVFGSHAVTNKELRDELLALTMYWKPWNPANVSAHYNSYRRSAVELYADALSVLLNSPGLLQQKAPKFYDEFWKHIDAKPEVKAALFNLQDFLNKGKVTVLEQRGRDIETMFAKGEEIMKRKAEEREARRNSWKGWWVQLKQQLVDRHEPITDRAGKAEKAGATFPAKGPGRDARNVLEEGLLVNNSVERFVRMAFETVVKPLEDAGLTMEDMGSYMFLRRAATERAEMANPLGFTPEAAKQQLMKMRLDLGMDKTTLLTNAVDRFHAIVWPIVQDAVNVGSYSKEAYATLAKNKDVYATFAVLDYLEDYVPAQLRRQIGTLKEVANPFTATVLKMVTLQHLNALQRSKRSTLDLLGRHFPTEVAPAATKWDGARHRPIAKPGWGLLSILENGAQKHYYVDPLIAEAFEKLDPNDVNAIVRVLDWSFQKIFYPLFISYNPAFLLWLSPMRDFKRTRRNLPGNVGRVKLAVNYLKTWNEAVSRMKGVPKDLVREMQANFAVTTPFEAFQTANRDDQLGRMLAKYKILDQPHKSWKETPAGKVLMAVPEWIHFYGTVLDSLPKLASYRILTRDMKMAPRSAAGIVRNYVGLPNTMKRGTKFIGARTLVPFWNVFMQGYRADLKLMTSPKTASGWWFKWARGDGLMAVLKGLATAGLLGAALKELFDGVSEYDKSNYNIVPLGYHTGGDFGKKVVYVRLPIDETSRFISGVTYKIASSLTGHGHGVSDIFAFGEGQFPSLNPALTVPERWAEYAAGQNPLDPFRGQPIIPTKEFEAGGWDSLQPMLSWTANESGIMNFVRWNPQAETATELTVSAIPGVNRIIKISDYGYREQQREAEKQDTSEKAKVRLSYPDNAQRLLSEYYLLRRISAENRTDPQSDRYATLNVWYNQVYKKLDEAIIDAGPRAGKSERLEMGELSKPFERDVAR